MSRALSRMLEIPYGVFGSLSCVTLTSDCEVLVDGCTRVEEYESDIVRLELCDQRIAIVGKGLCMRTFFGSQIQVCGKISEVKLL